MSPKVTWTFAALWKMLVQRDDLVGPTHDAAERIVELHQGIGKPDSRQDGGVAVVKGVVEALQARSSTLDIGLSGRGKPVAGTRSVFRGDLRNHPHQSSLRHGRLLVSSVSYHQARFRPCPPAVGSGGTAG